MNETIYNHVRECLFAWIKEIVTTHIFPLHEEVKIDFIIEKSDYIEHLVQHYLEDYYDPLNYISKDSNFHYPVKDLILKLSNQSTKVSDSWIIKEVGPIAKIITKHVETLKDHTQ